MRELSGHTTEDAYPKMFPVNSIHASAPRCTLASARDFREDREAYVVGWRNLALVDWHNRTVPQHHYPVAERGAT